MWSTPSNGHATASSRPWTAAFSRTANLQLLLFADTPAIQVHSLPMPVPTQRSLPKTKLMDPGTHAPTVAGHRLFAWLGRQVRHSTSFSGVDAPRVACDSICGAVEELMATMVDDMKAACGDVSSDEPLRPLAISFVRAVKWDKKCQMELRHAASAMPKP